MSRTNTNACHCFLTQSKWLLLLHDPIKMHVLLSSFPFHECHYQRMLQLPYQEISKNNVINVILMSGHKPTKQQQQIEYEH